MNFLNNGRTITAIDIDNNKKLIDDAVESSVIDFNKKRIRKIIKQKRTEIKQVLINEGIDLKSDEAQERLKLDVDYTNKLKLELYRDDETKKYRELEIIALTKQRENYNEIRKVIHFLNDMPYYASEIEKRQLQNHNEFKLFNDFIMLSSEHNDLLNDLLLKHKEIIGNKIQSIKKDKLTYIDYETNDDLSMKSLELLLLMKEMYTVPTGIDDIELFMKYDMKTNTDIAQEFSNILFRKISNGNLNKNIINEFLPKTDLQNNFGIQSNNNIVGNKLLATLFSNELITNNAVTVLNTTWDVNIETEKRTRYVYRTRTLGEVLFEITNKDTEDIEKKLRKQLYLSYDGQRPSTTNYHTWNGLQVFDLDLKIWVSEEDGNIDNLKSELHKYLSDFHWYLWICKSSSGRGLHIYTKVTPPHHVYLDIHDNEYLSKYAFKVNYYTKACVINDILYTIHGNQNSSVYFKQYKFLSPDEPIPNNTFFDDSVSRVTTGIRIGYDPYPLINNRFVDLHYSLGLSQMISGFNDYDRVMKVLLNRDDKYISKLDDEMTGLIQDIRNREEERNLDTVDISKIVMFTGDLDSISPLPRKSINYITRYNICNTLASLYGKDGLELAHFVLDSHKCGNVGEINSFYSCALTNRKTPSKIGLDILRRVGIVKAIQQSDDTETDGNNIINEINNSFKNEIKEQIDKSLKNDNFKPTYKLREDQYLSDLKNELGRDITGEKINIVLSPPGSGKTQYILEIAKSGKRVLLVLPYISVIKNKVETDKAVTELFDAYYGNREISKLEYGRNAVTTFDKFAKANYDKLSKMFDYIFIDESHLLFTSGYRIDTTSTAIRKIKELYFISNNDPFAAKIVMMTGTETGETHFFHEVSNVIRVAKPMQSKKLEFLICDDTLDAITRMASKCSYLIEQGYRIMIPTNKGDIYSEKIIGMIEYLLKRSVKYGYYKRSNTEQEICRLINNDNTVGDFEIIFCSNYLSVGVDINDNHKFASLYFGPFCGYEIEQFNARIRKTGIYSIYCLPTTLNDGSVNPLLINEPSLLLKITEDDTLHFIDDQSIASAKQEFIAEYDPALQKIVTPGFSLLNGKIQFNLEEYELLSFEYKYNECMEHPIKVSRELSRYGYSVSVSTDFEGLNKSEQETLKQMGLDSARNEKVRKHNLLVGTFVDLINQNTHKNIHGLEYNNVIDWIGKNADAIIEDRELANEDGSPRFVEITFDVFATPKEVIVRSREAFDKMYRPAKYLINKYSPSKAIEVIYKYIDDNGILKQKNFHRAINLLKLLDSNEANELSEPLVKTLEKMYMFVDKFEINKTYRIGYQTYRSVMESWTNEYIDLLGIKIHTKNGFDKIQDSLQEMLLDLASKSTGQNGIRFTYNKIPEQDSSNVINRRSIDTIIKNMFNIVEGEISKKFLSAKDKHIVLHKQDF